MRMVSSASEILVGSSVVMPARYDCREYKGEKRIPEVLPALQHGAKENGHLSHVTLPDHCNILRLPTPALRWVSYRNILSDKPR